MADADREKWDKRYRTGDYPQGDPTWLKHFSDDLPGEGRALDVAAAMFATPDGATLDGELRDAPNQPAPVQRPRPPIWLAAHGPVLLRLAGRRADGVIAAFCPPDEFARRRAIAEPAPAAAVVAAAEPPAAEPAAEPAPARPPPTSLAPPPAAPAVRPALAPPHQPNPG